MVATEIGRALHDTESRRHKEIGHPTAQAGGSTGGAQASRARRQRGVSYAGPRHAQEQERQREKIEVVEVVENQIEALTLLIAISGARRF
jgi:hypothetical protein